METVIRLSIHVSVKILPQITKYTSPKPLGQLVPNLVEMILWWSHFKVVQKWNFMRNSGFHGSQILKKSSTMQQGPELEYLV